MAVRRRTNIDKNVYDLMDGLITYDEYYAICAAEAEVIAKESFQRRYTAILTRLEQEQQELLAIRRAARRQRLNQLLRMLHLPQL